ncbi:PREDICTED: solute carrier family 35 member G2 [Nelumbo nucifera]|uniref:Solute carrier family 35 member G2 n=2 Tax=Nelumbo nucifera TaxID=4432 RepID=A0A1U7YXE6_NELNU|nr:PREDICTED: solute carrier family 35 member G2 [Nelumbo nucifera]DAD20377.1 TPA_asm: hypothetical protein HUJ06_021840 [Nelumbo nucifera]
MESAERKDKGGDHHVVELVVSDAAPQVSDQITPLLSVAGKPKSSIFSVSHPRRRPKEQVAKINETDVSFFSQSILWLWSGPKYSGLVCMALSSTIYFVMEILASTLSGQPIPLFEIVFVRCTIILISSFVWLKRTRQPIFGPTHVRKLLFSRALMGYLSLFSFVYSIQSLPLSQAIVLNFTTPIMASIMARIILNEKLKFLDVGGLICSFFGLLFIFRPILVKQGKLADGEKSSNTYSSREGEIIYALLVAMFSSITGGISYCLIRAGAKASDQPVVTVFSFGLLATPAAAICTFVLQEFVLPELYSFIFMVVLGELAFLAQVLLARALQLEKTSKVTNIQYIEVFLSQIWGIGLSWVAPSFGRLAGCLLIFISVGSTMFFGPEQENE